MSFQIDLQTLLKIRGVTAMQIHQKTGIGYYTIQKTIKGHRSARAVRNAIADYLDVDYLSIWGGGSARHIKQLITQAIEDRAKQYAKTEKLRLQNRFMKQSLTKTKAVING